jgi:hypothetical protein
MKIGKSSYKGVRLQLVEAGNPKHKSTPHPAIQQILNEYQRVFAEPTWFHQSEVMITRSIYKKEKNQHV